jgi:perosamine synthetase
MTFTATAEVVTYFNATPVIVDVDNETGNIDVAAIEKKISPKTKAIIPVHFAGQPCDMDEIHDVAKRHGCFVIEDAAHSLPATYKNRMIGKGSDIICFSFYATKTLSTGEGGMATTENGEWADKLRINRLHGITRDGWNRYSNEGTWKYEVLDAGFKYNMTDIQAALGVAQLRKLDWMWERRKSIAKQYDEVFNDFPQVNIPIIKADRESAWHLYVLRLNLDMLRIDRNRFIQELKKRGIGTSVHFIPLYRHPFYQNTYGYDLKDFPVSEKIYDCIVSLPLYPSMSDKDVELVTCSVDDILRKYKI